VFFNRHRGARPQVRLGVSQRGYAKWLTSGAFHQATVKRFVTFATLSRRADSERRSCFAAIFDQT
jgi:hypothetical protein